MKSLLFVAIVAFALLALERASLVIAQETAGAGADHDDSTSASLGTDGCADAPSTSRARYSVAEVARLTKRERPCAWGRT